MIRLKTAAIMASIMVTTTVTACAGDLTAVRVSDYDGASRIVFDMTTQIRLYFIINFIQSIHL